MEERRLRRVEILGGRFLRQRPAAKGDHPPARIADREHHPVAEPVIGDGNVITGDDKACFRHLLDADAPIGETRAQGGAVIRREAQAEFLLEGDAESPVGEIAPCFGPLGRLQNLLEEFCRQLHHIIECRLEFLAPLVLFRYLRHGKARFLRQSFDGFRKTHALFLGEEGEDVA